MKLLLLLLFCHVSSPVKHSMEYLLTASSGVPNLPDLVSSAVVDDILVAYCDTNEKIVEPKQDWMKKFLQHFPEYMEQYTQVCLVYLPYEFKATIFRLKQDLNQTGGIHTLQERLGCEWDDETGEVNGFNQYGYDGEDLMSFDLKTLTWIAPKPQAVITKMRWDASKYVVLDVDGNYITQMCPSLLKIYVSYGKSFLLRTDFPSVSLLQKSPSSPVSCHATGFFPDRAMMFWRKDGEEIHEDVDHGEILPNHDGSFQMSVDLNLSSVTPEDWRRYDCVFHLSGVKDDIITKLDKAVIRTNLGVSPSQFPAGAVIGVVVGLLLLTLCITGLFIWRRNHHGFRPANNSSPQLDNTLALTDHIMPNTRKTKRKQHTAPEENPALLIQSDNDQVIQSDNDGEEIQQNAPTKAPTKAPTIAKLKGDFQKLKGENQLLKEEIRLLKEENRFLKEQRDFNQEKALHTEVGHTTSKDSQ